MAKTLKMGFAMGGGVSLGSFSGAGLSEAIKQAVLNAGYYEDIDGQKKFTRYKNVVVDVFSGASAGSMALAIMLRGLAHQTDDERINAIATLEKEGIDLDDPATNKEDLIAAQVVQDLQKKIWTKEINLRRLLGETRAQKDEMTYEAGLLRRGALEDIACNNFQLDDAFNTDFERKRILGDQVLFASTLSNLTGIIYDGRDDKDLPNFKGTKDPFTSQCHKELRVFHLLFKSVSANEIDNSKEKYPSKWVRYHMGPKTDGYVSDLRSQTAWSRMVTTSMACGAFPFAFEPVPLERFQFEYGKKVWDENGLTPEVCRLAMELEHPQPDGRLSYPFCYVDGGTFNNEPVREAFRMASFLDSEDTSDFDRVIVFVDPSVGDEGTDFNLPFLKQYTLKNPRKFLGVLDGFDVVRNSSLDRLLPHVGTLVKMLTDEGRVKESNKIVQVADLFTKSEAYYKILDSLLNDETNTVASIAALAEVIDGILITKKEVDIVPAGSLTFKGELVRVLKDKRNSALSGLLQYTDKFTKELLSEIPETTMLCKALFRVFIDLMMDLAGKDPNCKIIAIAPTEKVNGTYVGFDLPGGALQAFSGFASEEVNVFQGNMAMYCTRSLMRDLKLLPDNFDLGVKPEWTDADKADFKAAFRAQLGLINARIDNFLNSSHVIDVFPVVDYTVLSQISKMIKQALARVDFDAVHSQSCRFLVEVNDSAIEIDGSGSFNDAKPFIIDGKKFLVTELSYYANKIDGRFWDGVHAQRDELVIDREGISVFPDTSFCTIALPTKEQVELASKMPNPTFLLDKKLESSDKGKHFDNSHWKIKPGIKLPETTLLDAKVKQTARPELLASVN